MSSKHLFYIIWCLGLLNSARGIFCPLYCKCHMKDSYRYVACVNKGIISLDLTIPTSAQWIQLSNNSIDILHNYVFQREKLLDIMKLDLDFNNINEIEEYAFYDLYKLEEVDLRGNHLFQIRPSIFLSNLRLIKLDLSLNPLRNPVIQSQSLKELSMSKCQLRYIRNSTFEYLPNLKSLNISFNLIQYIDPYTLVSQHNLQFVDLSRNLFVCDQHTTELNLLLSRHNIGYKTIICDQNERKFEKMILSGDPSDISDEEFDCCKCDDTTTVVTQKNIEIIKQSKEIIDFPFLFFSIVTAFGIGMCFAYFTVALAVLLIKYFNKRKRHSLLIENSPTPQGSRDPTAPPPSYHMLFSK